MSARLTSLLPRPLTVVAAAIFAVSLAAGMVGAQQSLPPRLRGPAIEGPDFTRLQRGQTAYVTANCHFCHGPTLRDARGGGADLGHSRLIQNDVDGDMIAPVVSAGLPYTQTAMPRYPDMSAERIRNIAAYVHYMRGILHYEEAVAEPATGGDVTKGRALYGAQCAACHQGRASLIAAALPKAAKELRERILRPAPTLATARIDAPGRVAHLRLLEAVDPAQARDLTAFVGTLDAPLSAVTARAMQPPLAPVSERYAQQCAMCHGASREKTDRAPALFGNPDVRALGREGIAMILQQGLPGGMPAFTRLSKSERDALAGYVLSNN